MWRSEVGGCGVMDGWMDGEGVRGMSNNMSFFIFHSIPTRRRGGSI